jgi:outer membrane receptor protein involved in Fe transport
MTKPRASAALPPPFRFVVGLLATLGVVATGTGVAAAAEPPAGNPGDEPADLAPPPPADEPASPPPIEPPPVSPEPSVVTPAPAGPVAPMPEEDTLGLSLTQLLDMSLTTGSFLELDLRNSVATLTVIERKQIQASGARTLSELAEIFVPGFQYMYNKWNGDIWGMRGVAPDRNTKMIFLVNGLKMNHESRDGVFSEINLGMLDDIERVEVLRGPAGLVYGSGAIAGVVNVVTRRAGAGKSNVRVSNGRWGNNQVEGLVNHTTDQGVAVGLSFGLRRYEGISRTSNRIYGDQSWPAPTMPNPNDPTMSISAPSADGWPADGRTLNTPSNMRASLDIGYKDFRLYSRVTHQRFGVGGFFVLDGYPDIVGNPPMDAGSRTINGIVINPGDPLSTTESYGTNRRHQIVDNISTRATYSPQIGADKLTIEAGVVGVTNRIVTEPRVGYPGDFEQIDSTMGERRYLAGANYLLRRVPRLRSAVGFQYRVDDLGKDLTGLNMHANAPLHPEISNVVYQSIAVYTENQVEVTTWLKATAGLRVDKHTRTGVVLSPMAGLLWFPHQDHVVKAVVQASSNNGSADNYEYNWRHYTNAGTVDPNAHLEIPTNPMSAIIPPVTQRDLHSLRPEKAIGIEGSWVGRFGYLTHGLSGSVTRISDLFTWNQDLFRVINAGEYKFVNAELDVRFDGLQRFGLLASASHVYSRPFGHIAPPSILSVPTGTPVMNTDGSGTYTVMPTGTRPVEVDAIRSQITQNGKSFLNLSTNVTKLFASYAPTSWMTFSTSLRVFWGLGGRTANYNMSSMAGHNYLGVNDKPILKLNVGASFALPQGFTLGVHGYDLLGTVNTRNAVRWQQMASSDNRQLYVTDLPAWMVTLDKTF